ncbi:MAG: selenocysteine-specific translation elongation factor [Eubacteriaceae bacterium]
MQDEKNIIIGTAGHVDHGKTSLIKALTGFDTDRLKEEKERGITIELGFAWLKLPNGEKAGIIDVPGHERFIKNMFAGAGGIDLALLVIAADEGVMPQTIEHLRILTLLGIPRGLIVLTKCDLVEAEWLDLVEEDIRELMKDSLMETSEIIRVSGITGEGIEALKTEIFKEISFCRGKPTDEALRIPVDRVFTISGFGTVVTGTIFQGTICEGEEVTIYPQKMTAKVRTLEVHGEKTNQAVAGQRVAVNFSGIKKEEIKRGNVVALADSLLVTYQLDVYLKALMDEERVIKNNSRVHFYCGAMEALCKVVLIGEEQLEPGGECYAQLRFEEPMALKAGDRFVIRFYSPMETIGGGVVLDPFPNKHKRWDIKALESMKCLHKGSKEERFVEGVRIGSQKFKTSKEIIQRLNLEEEILKLEKEYTELIKINEDIYLHKEFLEVFEKRLIESLTLYHENFPLRQGMSRDELRSKLRFDMDIHIMDDLLTYYEISEIISYKKGMIALISFKPVYDREQEKCKITLEKMMEDSKFLPPRVDDYDPIILKDKYFKQVLEALLLSGEMFQIEPKLYFSKKRIKKAMEIFKCIESDHDGVGLGEFRDAVETSRKYGVSLLENWDSQGYTKKTGDIRKSTQKMDAFLENEEDPLK